MNKDNVINILREKGVKITLQRRFVIESVLNDRTHPCAEDVYFKVKKKLPEISLATVYQTLDLLEREGLLLKISFPDGKSHFDPFIKPHFHFYCENCGKIEDRNVMNENPLKDIIKREKTDFEVKNYTIMVYGFCKKCKSKGA